MKIGDLDVRTEYVHPPIPCREHDWCAWIDGEEEYGPMGWGRTEDAAISDLINEIKERDQCDGQ